ncbi:MAG: peptidyl-prolyl cis-trans isomerase [Deltaproteobacteria bacterium]|nr:peptidyl-prolyl cis-trans isomerase [Deltaproteobacteria bacterium]
MQTRSAVTAGIVILIVLALTTMRGIIATSLASDQDQVIAVVNSEPIHLAQLEPLIAEYQRQTRKKQVSAEDKMQLLKNLIRRNLILQQDYTQQLRKSEEITKRVKEYEDQLVLQKYIKIHVLDFLTVGDEEAKQYYLNNLQKFAAPPRVRASHILLRSETEAKQVLKKLQAGESFSELAKQYSIDLPMAFEGGSMGTIEQGKGLPQLEKVLFILDEGEFSDILKTQYGWHILRVDEKITAQYAPYETAREKIKVILKREKEARAYDTMTQQLEKEANITIYENRL